MLFQKKLLMTQKTGKENWLYKSHLSNNILNNYGKNT